MAHKTLIGGTAYEIGGGRTLVNGTGYSIDKGKTLVGGTAYEVGFAPPEPTAMLYSDGAMVFQIGDEPDASHGTLVASFPALSDDGAMIPAWRDYRDSILSISFKDEITPVGSTAYCFDTLTALKSFDGTNLNTSQVTTMERMFYGCRALTSLNVTGFDTSNVETMLHMFGSCSVLTTLDLSSFNTSKVKNMGSVFNGCANLVTIYASDLWSVEAVTHSTRMFKGCTKLVGAISYDSSKVDATYANYTNGYFTYKTAP